MGKREENLKRLQELGLIPSENQGTQSPGNTQSDEQTDENGKPKLPEQPETDSSKSPDGHDWEKRKADAQAAQRALSAQARELDEKKRDVEALLADLDLKTEELKRLQANTQPKIDDTPSDEPDPLEDYPELSQAVDAKTQALIKKAIQAEKDREKAEREAAESQTKAEEAKAKKILDEVFEAHPDAAEVVNSKEFQDWLNSLHPRLSKEYRDYIQRTTLYSAKDAIDVLDEFKAFKPSKQTKVDSDLDIPIPPSGQVPNGGPSGKGLRVLTREEMASIHTLIRNAKTQEERKLWMDRLHYTFAQSSER